MLNKSKKTNIPMAVLMGILCAFSMVMIFLFSYQGAEVSAGESMSLYTYLVQLFGGREIISHNAFRKLAHFGEFTFFSFCFFGMMYFIKKAFCVRSSLIFCVLYSMSDEVHQYFVPERACRVFDVFVDSMGIIFGITVFYILCIALIKLTDKIRHDT